MKVVQFLGYSGGGKTRAISYTARALRRRGYRVGTLKHIHRGGFTLDAKGKDTWSHARSGASIVAALAPGELALFMKTGDGRMNLDELLGVFRKSGIDYLLVEGLSAGFRGRRRPLQVVCARSPDDAARLFRVHGDPLCVVGEFERHRLDAVPVVRLPRDTQELIRLIGAARRRERPLTDAQGP